MLKNAYLLAKIGADTAENERHLPKFDKKLRLPYPTLRAALEERIEAVVEAIRSAELVRDFDWKRSEVIWLLALLQHSRYSADIENQKFL